MACKTGGPNCNAVERCFGGLLDGYFLLFLVSYMDGALPHSERGMLDTAGK